MALRTLACRVETLQKLPCKPLMPWGFPLCDLCGRNEFKTMLSGLLAEVADLLLPIPFLV